MKEQRRAERVVPAQQPKGELVLSVEGLTFDVKKVCDASPFGIGIFIDGGISRDTEIKLHYRCGDVDITVYGVIAWNVAIDDEDNNKGLFHTGLCLRPEDVEANLRFYRLMVGQKV